jgi:uncharacterized protein YbbK (DUF523 family)
MSRPILVSACLLGLNTRYDGRTKKNQSVLDYLRDNDLQPIPVCPEQLGGLPTPRPQTWFQTGDGAAVLDGDGEVINIAGESMNETFIRGAQATLEIAQLSGCELALLKQRSPSCGVGQIYQGEQVVAGDGVTTALLKRHQIHIQSEDVL